jgi:hypothetical protein
MPPLRSGDQDRNNYAVGCDHPGECIETAKILIDSLSAKWNPTMQNLDLCEDLSLTDEEREGNKLPVETGQIMVYDPDYSLRDIANGFRVFAFEDSLTELPARRYKILDDEPSLMSIFIHASVRHAAKFNPIIQAMIQTEVNGI